ncbi:MAG: thiamine-phosphate kinase [Rhodospirillaceae bacterium]|nr:thiamine-phosphate kinase [Rhodospirillaceae bacterium]
MPGEFAAIARYFAPLATHPGSFGLQDDLAWLKPRAGRRLVLKTDAIVVGVHTLETDPSDLVARKALRVNLSDLAAKGARPLGYMLALMLPAETEAAWLAGFARGLAADQAEFGLPLLGGDMTRTPGPPTISMTVLGEAPKGRPLLRGGARPGDVVYVSGTIGDAALGLMALQGRLPGLAARHRRYLAHRYRLPRPRLALGAAVSPFASASMDISDGLVADLGHICKASGCGAEIDLAAVPISPAAAAAGSEHALRRLTGGDDYELLLAVPARHEARLRASARRSSISLTRIGCMVRRPGVRVRAADGRPIGTGEGGWQHF